jgi:hypothetical protein
MNKEERKAYNKQYYQNNKEYFEQYRLDNREKKRAYNKQYDSDNKEKISERKKVTDKQYYQNNKEKISEKGKRWYHDNKEKKRAYDKQYYSDNREKRKAYHKQYRLDNREKKRAYQNKKYHSDPLFKFKEVCRSRAYMAFKRKSWRKNGSTEKLLGCDWETAMNHIESQFEYWMNWDNHGEWEIDHIIPLASANTKEEMIPLFNYKNLQPLLAEDNMRKGGRITKKSEVE